MMGIYFAMTGFGNKVAGLLGESASNLGEYTVFTGIAVFCILFGILVLVVRKKLESLTHGAEDKEGNILEQEKYDLANPEIHEKSL